MTNSIFSPKPGSKRIDRQIAREARNSAYELDLELSSVEKVCREGCDHCCYQTTWVNSWEAEEISRYVIEKMSDDTKSIVKNQMENWHKWFDSVSRKSTRESPLTFYEVRQLDISAAENHIPCPYLIDNKCSIYKARPFMCRTHIVKKSPEQCREEPLRDSEINRSELIKKYIYERYDKKKRPIVFKPLPYIMIEGIEVECEKRPMLGFIIGGEDK